MDMRQDEILDFWFRELTPEQWFQDGEQLDSTIAARFGELHEEAVSGRLESWAATPLGRLALILVLDQFSRNIHRGTARAFETDAKAQQLTLDGIAAGMDEKLAFAQRQFFYMPLMHAEDPVLQAKSIERFTALKAYAEMTLKFAESHRAEVERFGRFPHRNEAIGRASSAEERDHIAATADY